MTSEGRKKLQKCYAMQALLNPPVMVYLSLRIYPQAFQETVWAKAGCNEPQIYQAVSQSPRGMDKCAVLCVLHLFASIHRAFVK